MSRSDRLIQLAIKALDLYEDPLHESFLRKHEVTLDEACGLADTLSLGLQLVQLHKKPGSSGLRSRR